jgi:hypothetical protein
VDPWCVGVSTKGYAGPGEHGEVVARYGGSLFAAFLGSMREHSPAVLERLHVVRSMSCDVELYVSADVVFIDGDHSEAAVRSDIASARRWLKPGGILAGHDYNRENPYNDFAGLCDAVDELCPTKRIGFDTEWSSVWWVEP